MSGYYTVAVSTRESLEARMGSEIRFRTRMVLTLIGLLVILFSRAEAASIGQLAPELTNTVWINSAPLQLADLRGKVILLEFWTYG